MEDFGMYTHRRAAGCFDDPILPNVVFHIRGADNRGREHEQITWRWSTKDEPYVPSLMTWVLEVLSRPPGEVMSADRRRETKTHLLRVCLLSPNFSTVFIP